MPDCLLGITDVKESPASLKGNSIGPRNGTDRANLVKPPDNHKSPLPRNKGTDKQGIYRIKLRITLPDSYKLFLYSLGVTPFIRKKKRPKVVESA